MVGAAFATLLSMPGPPICFIMLAKPLYPIHLPHLEGRDHGDDDQEDEEEGDDHGVDLVEGLFLGVFVASIVLVTIRAVCEVGVAKLGEAFFVLVAVITRRLIPHTDNLLRAVPLAAAPIPRETILIHLAFLVALNRMRARRIDATAGGAFE